MIKTREELYDLFAERGYKVGAEIGVADGRNALAMFERIPDLLLHCIDPWEPYKLNTRGGGTNQQHGNYDLARERLSPYNANFLRGFSTNWVTEFDDEQLDFVYIDGNHDFDFVMTDLIQWTPKVRKGGVVSGHDYYHFKKNPAGVVEAVDAYCGAHGITFNLTEQRETTFWWTK